MKQSLPTDVMSTLWLESMRLSRTEYVKYVKSGWLTRMNTGIYRFSHVTPTLYDALASYEKQMGKRYRIGASSALELHGYTHYVAYGKPTAYVFTPLDNRLPKWISTYEWERTL